MRMFAGGLIWRNFWKSHVQILGYAVGNIKITMEILRHLIMVLNVWLHALLATWLTLRVSVGLRLDYNESDPQIHLLFHGVGSVGQWSPGVVRFLRLLHLNVIEGAVFRDSIWIRVSRFQPHRWQNTGCLNLVALVERQVFLWDATFICTFTTSHFGHTTWTGNSVVAP